MRFGRLCLALGLPLAAWAHEDPPGDVHPRVKAVGDRFEVFFESNHVAPGRRPRYRVCYTREGKLALPRKAVPAAAEQEDTRAGESGGEALTVSTNEGGEDRAVGQITRSGATEEIQFEYPLAAKSYIAQTLVHRNAVILLVSFGNGDPEEKRRLETSGLHFLEFSRDGGPPQRRVRLGIPGYVYYFPRVSNLLRDGERCRVSWVEEVDRKTTGRFTEVRARLVLSTWDLKTGRLRHRELSQNIGWNTSLSMAAIGTRGLVAWHWYGRTGRCEIQTVGFDFD